VAAQSLQAGAVGHRRRRLDRRDAGHPGRVTRRAHDWIRIVTRKGPRRARGGARGVVDAFLFRLRHDRTRSSFDYVCKLDLDLRMPPRYFELLIQRMKADPFLATCSGKTYIEEGGALVYERHGDENSIGAAKFYRMSSFLAIGGFVREVGWDGIDGHMCRMKGWEAVSWDEPELRFIHLRPQGSSHKGVYTGRLRQGFGQYYMGTSLLYLTASAVSRFQPEALRAGAAHHPVGLDLGLAAAQAAL
jgi:biofilm PGA synthesis N-glycosyltransferase PgaC